MNARKMLLTAATASLTLLAASCHDDDSGGSGNASTVSELVADEIAGSTNETAEPIDLNSRVLSLMDTDETTFPVPVN